MRQPRAPRLSLVSLALLLLPAFLYAACCGPTSGDPAARRGIQAMADGKHAEAVEQLRAGLELGLQEEDPALVHTVLGNALMKMGKLDEAIAAHEAALKLDPKAHRAWVNLGVAWRHKGKYEEAERCYRKAQALAPEYPELWASLGGLQVLRGKSKDAIVTLEKAIQLDPSLAVAHSNLALAYAAAGRFDDAEQSLKQAVLRGYTNSAAVKKRIAELRALAAPAASK